MNLLAGAIDIASLCFDTENCLCWLIILLDIFAIFYLVFVSFYKVTKIVRMTGWIWIGVLITADVIIVAIHPCVLTLLCVLFTIMIMTAMLSVVLPDVAKGDGDTASENPERKDFVFKPILTPLIKRLLDFKRGSYVIREVDADKYCFEIYDRKDNFLVRSFKCFKSVAGVKRAIALTREQGAIAEVEDRTLNWIKEVNHPKFEMFKDGEVYRFKMTADKTTVIFKSPAYETVEECKKQLDKTVAAVASTAVYISVEKLSAADARQYRNMDAVDADEEVAATAVLPTDEKPVSEIAAETDATSESAVVINGVERKTLGESYAELSATQKAFFDGLRKSAQNKDGAKEYESSAQLTFVLFKNNLLRIRIRRNTVEAVFLLMDAAFKQLHNDEVRIKETKTVIKIENDTYYALALETLDKKYNLLLEQKKEREEQRKAERREKAKQKRLSKNTVK